MVSELEDHRRSVVLTRGIYQSAARRMNGQNPFRVQAVIYKPSGKILVVRRIPDDGGFWQTVTGTPQKDESMHDAVRREVKEEVGISVNSISDCFYSFTWRKNGQRIDEFVYSTEVREGINIQLGDEHDRYVWVTPERAICLVGKVNNKKSLKVFIKWKRNSDLFAS